MNRIIIAWAAASGAIAVILGALGAHALKDLIDTESLDSFNTGIRYQAWHAIALLVVGFSSMEIKFKKSIFRLWVIGSMLFSFSIYLLSTSSITSIPSRFLGPITPIGGLLLISGWLLLFVGALKGKATQNQK